MVMVFNPSLEPSARGKGGSGSASAKLYLIKSEKRRFFSTQAAFENLDFSEISRRRCHVSSGTVTEIHALLRRTQSRG
jgi:hypothetical protein